MFGPERLLEEDIVLVTLNYRLGALGFLTSGDMEAPPNVGDKFDKPTHALLTAIEYATGSYQTFQ